MLDDLRFALTLDGSLDLAAIAAWTPPPVPVSGPGTFQGTFAGPLGGYTLSAKFASRAATIARVPEVALDGVLTLTSPRAVIEPLTITTPPQGGTTRRGVFAGRFVYQFGDPGGSDLTGTYRDFDLDMALALYDQDPVAAAAWEQGTVRLGRDTREAPLRLHATGRSTRLVRADRVALDGTWEATLDRDRWFARHDHQLLDAARVFGTAQVEAAGHERRRRPRRRRQVHDRAALAHEQHPPRVDLEIGDPQHPAHHHPGQDGGHARGAEERGVGMTGRRQAHVGERDAAGEEVVRQSARGQIELPALRHLAHHPLATPAGGRRRVHAHEHGPDDCQQTGGRPGERAWDPQPHLPIIRGPSARRHPGGSGQC